MLYGYSTKNNSPIHVKFILNQAGTLDHRTYYDYSLATGKEPLTVIEPESIKEGVNNGTLVPIFNDQNFLIWYNMYLGNKFTDSQINEMIDGKK